MSMLCCMLALTPRQMKTLRARPDLTFALSNTHFDEGGAEIEAAAEVDDAEEEALSPQEDASHSDADADGEDDDDEYDEDDDDDEDIDLGTVFDEPVRKSLELMKSWAMLRFLMMKFEVDNTEIPANGLLEGELIGDEVGYGSASLRDAAETERFARFLQSVDLDRLLSRVNYREMLAQKLYAFPYGDKPDAFYEAEVREDLTEYYPQLRDYVAKAAAAKHGLLVWLE